ncbi:MAG: phenylacetate--CoA ligase family protein [Patescibacteria group bacterium]|nr:phenylacetate--CoA ligase family protein [Patescibacteria group bacterium]
MRLRRSSARVIKKKTPARPRSFTVSPSFIAKLRTNESADWSRATSTAILKRFKDAYKNVSAYRHFLERLNIDPVSIRTSKDVKRIPPITKENYLRVHPWEKLCVAGALAEEPLVLTATSGSTGQPFYIPRTDEVHDSSMVFHRLFMERSGLDPAKSTLVVVAFGMGVWIGGILTYEALRRISEHGWPLTVITPGVNKKEIFEALTHVASAYEQVVLCGYPPFVKDLIDDAPEHGIEWKQWDIRIVCAAEAFSEHFREYLMQKTGMKDPYRSVMNIYGSAELGTMATETPLSILLRRLALKHEALYRKLFSEAHRLPTLAQFIPDFVSFEAGTSGEVYATGGTALPFIRYDIGDQGGVFSYADAVRMCTEVGIDLIAEAKRTGIGDTVMELPFVYLYERADLSVKLYGAIIYPEHVKIGLQNPALEKFITGRFTMTTEHDAKHNEYLEINIELQRGVKDGEPIQAALVESVVKSLSASSGEYQNNHVNMGDRVFPRIVFWPHGHPKYFHPGIKQKWVMSS